MRLAPVGPADSPFTAFDDNRHPALTRKQRKWELDVRNASRLLEVWLLGQHLKLWYFKAAVEDIRILVHELQQDPYQLLRLPRPTGEKAMALDLGANIGVIPVLLAKLWAGTPFRLNVVYVEAAPSNYRYLLWNLRVNNVWDRVWPINAAVGGTTEGTRVVQYSPFFPTGNPG